MAQNQSLVESSDKTPSLT